MRHAFDHGEGKGFCRVKDSIEPEALRAGGWVGGSMGGWVGLRVGFIKINDMYNDDGGQGGARVCEAHEVK